MRAIKHFLRVPCYHCGLGRLPVHALVVQLRVQDESDDDANLISTFGCRFCGARIAFPHGWEPKWRPIACVVAKSGSEIDFMVLRRNRILKSFADGGIAAVSELITALETFVISGKLKGSGSNGSPKGALS